MKDEQFYAFRHFSQCVVARVGCDMNHLVKRILLACYSYLPKKLVYIFLSSQSH